MYAVIETGGKQYRVREGDVVRVERLDHEVGSAVEIDAVHLLSDEGDVQVGRPLLDGARVRTTVIEQGRGSKVVAFKKKRRKGYRRKVGHRQPFTALRVDEILAPGGKGGAKKKKAKGKAAPEKDEEKAADKATEKKAEKATKKKAAKKAAEKDEAGKVATGTKKKKTKASEASAKADEGGSKTKKKGGSKKSGSKSKDE